MLADINETLELIKGTDLPAQEFEALTNLRNGLLAKQKELSDAAKTLKKEADKVDDVIRCKMKEMGITKTTTEAGNLRVYEFRTLQTDDAEAFKNVLRGGVIEAFFHYIGGSQHSQEEVAGYLSSEARLQDNLDWLTKTPYSKDKLKAVAAEEGGELPDGVGWYREMRLSITKK